MTSQEPTMEKTGVGRKGFFSALRRPIVVLLLLQLMAGIMLAPYRTFFPIYVKDLGYSAVLIAALATVERIMGLIAALVGGTLSDSWGRKWTLMLGQLGFLLSTFVFFSPSIGWIFVLWAAGGLGLGLSTLGGQSYLMDAASPAYLGVLAALYNWGYTLGGTVSNPVAGLLLDTWGYAALGVSATVLALATLSVTRFALPHLSASVVGKSPVRKLVGYRIVATRPPIILLSMLRFLPTFLYGMIILWIPLLLDASGVSKTTIALYAAISQAAASLAQFAAGRAADRLGGKWPLVIASSVLVISGLGIGLLPGQLWSIFAFGILGTAAAWSISSLFPGMVAQVAAAEERGRVLGWVHLWWNVAMIAGAMTGGILFERWAGLPFLVAGMVNLPSVALAFVFFRMAAREQSTS